MAEPFGWMFVDFIPLIYDKKRLAKQFQIETWLNLSEVAKELGLKNLNGQSPPHDSSIDYVV